MSISTKSFAAAFFAVPLVATLTPTTQAAGAKDTDARIQALQQQLEALQNEITDLKRAQTDQAADAKKQIAEIQDRTAETEKQVKSNAKVSMANGRPTFSSADGNFTASIRANIQTDFGYYMQGRRAASLGSDLSSGANVRRAQLGVQGKVFGDWSYNFLYDFGGAGYETPGKILYAYLQYDGLAPFAVRVGAFAPAYSIEDQQSSSELMFLERNTPTNMVRNVAGSEGRLGVALIYAGDTAFGSLAYTASKIAETGANDEQQALVGRASYMAINDKENDFHLLLGGGFMHVFKLPDALANGQSGTQHTLSLSDMPEITVDDNSAKLISTGTLGAGHFTAWNLEMAGNYQNVFLQGAYSGIQVSRATTAYTVYSSPTLSTTVKAKPRSNDFSAWYLQASWVITGESKAYVASTGTFSIPKPSKPLSLANGGWGAWEIAVRYSDTDLNDGANDTSGLLTGWTNAGVKTYTFYNAVRGGEQRNVALGINWYPNNALRFQLDYMWIDIDRLQATSTTTTPSTTPIGQNVQAVALRAQIAF
jgi:phosphate-selective porin OprO and OprP